MEIFDIEKNEVINVATINMEIHEETEKMLNSIDGLVRTFKPIPEKGYMIKIPIEPPHTIENQWLNDLIDELIIIIPEQGEPTLLVYDNENKMYFFTFARPLSQLFLKYVS